MENGSTGAPPHLQHSRNNKLLMQIINYSENKGHLLTKFTAKYIAEALSIRQLENWSQKFSHPRVEVTLEEFIALLGCAVPHSKYESLFLIMSLAEIYKEIRRNLKYQTNEQTVYFSSITDYFCEKISSEQSDVKIHIKASKKSENGWENGRSACIKLLFEQTLPRISKQQVRRQKTLKGPINRLFFCSKSKLLICLTSLDTKIQLYDTELKLKNTIVPTSSIKFKTESLIMSMGYSPAHQRIGCLVHGFGLVFWQASDCFETEKVIPNVRATFIQYLPKHDIWLTASNNCISVWDIYRERQHLRIQMDDVVQIACIEEVCYLGMIVVSVTLKNKRKQLRAYELSPDKSRLLAHAELEATGCHHLLTNISTQSILQLGFSSTIKIWECDPVTYELVGIGELRGNVGTFVSVVNVGSSSIVATGDDRGEVRLWDLKHTRCFQTVKISRKEINQLLNVNDVLFVGDNRINALQLEGKKQHLGQSTYFSKFYDDRHESVYLFSRSSCSIVDMQTGEAEQIYLITDSDEELTCVERMKNLLCLGTNRGNIIVIDMQFKGKIVVKAHDMEVLKLIASETGNYLVSVAHDAVMMWVPGPGGGLELRKVLAGLPGQKQGNALLVQLHKKSHLLSLCLGNEIYLFEIENFRLMTKLVFGSRIETMKFHLSSNMLIVVEPGHQMQFVEFYRMDFELKITKIVKSFTNCFTTQASKQQDCLDQQKVTQMALTKANLLICGTNRGNVQIYDMGRFQVSNKIGLSRDEKTSKKGETNFFKAVKENFSMATKQSKAYQVDVQQFCKISQEPIRLVIGLNIGQNMAIEHLDEDEELGTVTTICSEGKFRIHHAKTLKTLCQRSSKQICPLKWQRLSMSNSSLKNKIIESIKTAQKVYNMKFKPELADYVDINKIDIIQFLSALASQQLQSVDVISFLQPLLNLILSKKKPSYIVQPTKMSLKAMETQKRVRKMSCMNESELQRPLKAKKLFKSDSQSFKFQNPLADPFFRHSIERRPGIIEPQEDDCPIYNRISQNYNKWKQKERVKSLSNLTKLHQKQNASLHEKNGYKLLKVKIQNLAERKDRRSQLLKKIFKKNCSQIQLKR